MYGNGSVFEQESLYDWNLCMPLNPSENDSGFQWACFRATFISIYGCRVGVSSELYMGILWLIRWFPIWGKKLLWVGRPLRKRKLFWVGVHLKTMDGHVGVSLSPYKETRMALSCCILKTVYGNVGVSLRTYMKMKVFLWEGRCVTQHTV